MTATTLRAEQTGLTALGRSGGAAQGRAATNPVAALPCARTPLPHPLSIPLLTPLLIPPSATVGVNSPSGALFGLVRGTDPRPVARKPRARLAGVSGEAAALAGH